MSSKNRVAIVYSAMKTPDGTLLESRYTHDYVTHTDKNGKVYMLDGGLDYVRSSMNGDEEYITVMADAPHSEIREVLRWGTYGKDGTGLLTFVLLKDMSTNHIQAILDEGIHMYPHRLKAFHDELLLRKDT